MPTFSLVIRCDDNSEENVIAQASSDDAQEALDLLMADLKDTIRDYDRNPDIYSED